MATSNLICYANGEFKHKSSVSVNVTDLAIVRGYGVFDYLRTYHRRPFRIGDYLDRFENSCSAMNLGLELSRIELIEAAETLISKNQDISELGIRFIRTGGEAADGYTLETPSLFMLAEELPIYPDWQFTGGIHLHTWEHQRELPRVKTINYLTAVRLTEERKRLNVQDTLYYSNGKILECTRNNFFLFRGNTLVTSSSGMLEGITRKTVLELAHGLFEIEIRDVALDELSLATECFITGSTRGVCPVVQIDCKLIGSGNPGNNTITLMKKWKEFTAQGLFL